MSDPKNVSKIIDQMYNHDAFSQWLGIERVVESPGHCVLQMKVRTEMTNGFGIAHGGITYSLADSALAFASNSHGQKAVSIETSISHTKPVFPDDILTATAKEESLGVKIAIYQITVSNQKNELVPLFKGTVFRRKESW